MFLFQSRLLSKKYLNETRCIFEFTKPDNFLFKEGQFISIKVADKTFRSYSLISCASSNTIHIYLDLSPNGVGSKYLNSLQVNSTIAFAGPFGNLILPEDFEKYSYNFIATGAGISPLVSIISYLVSNNIPPATLLYSEKYGIDFFPIEGYIETSNIKIIKTLTRENFPGLSSGRVTLYLNKLKFGKNSYFYICGNKNMVVEVSEILKKEYNVKKTQIVTESFY